MKTLNVCATLILGTAFLLSCTPKAQTNIEETSVQQEITAQPRTDEDTFSVTLPKDGAVFTINPKPGFKINADFPHRAILSAGEIQETALTDHNEKRLVFNMVAESKLPITGVKAETSFSVCNDQMCKLYKKSYQW